MARKAPSDSWTWIEENTRKFRIVTSLAACLAFWIVVVLVGWAYWNSRDMRSAELFEDSASDTDSEVVSRDGQESVGHTAAISLEGDT